MAQTRRNSKFHRQTQLILDQRPSAVVPVGAWVEICSQQDSYAAVHAARYEEERLQRIHAEKEAKLARFRQDVKSRVRELQRVKRQQQLEESYHSVNVQGRVVQRTAASANVLSHRKDTCVYQSSDPHAIGHAGEQSRATLLLEALSRGGAGDGRGKENTMASQQVREQAGHTKRLVQKAKQDLAAKQLAMKPKASPFSMPGGIWAASFSRDRPPTVADTEAPKVSDSVEGGFYEGSENYLGGQQEEDQTQQQDMLLSRLKHVTFAPENARSPQNPAEVEGHWRESDPDSMASHRPVFSGGLLGSSEGSSVPHGYEALGSDRSKALKRVKGHDEEVRGRLMTEVNPGVAAEEQRRQQSIQFSMFRRLYMDIEREQVREGIRRKAHQKTIQQVKKMKERERLEAERQSELMMQQADIIGETEMETRQRELEEAEEIKKIQTRLKQKNKETKRFIRALRAMMKERVSLLGITPPPLCACGPTVWDANPDTCANNCLFYKNPKAYAKALASVLAVNDTG